MQTQSEGGRINPARDGAFARVRSAFLRFGAAAAAGTAIGAGGAVIDQHFIHKVNGNVNDTQVKSEISKALSLVNEIDQI